MAKKKESEDTRVFVAQNRKARHEYFIEDTVEAGVVLTGTEVKSLRAGRATISDAHAGHKQGEIWLFNANIPEFAGGNRNNHEPLRPRKLLLHKRQMEKFLGLTKQKGMTLVPLSIYFNDKGFAKVLIGVARGKKEYDKREVKKTRDWEREKARLLKK